MVYLRHPKFIFLDFFQFLARLILVSPRLVVSVPATETFGEFTYKGLERLFQKNSLHSGMKVVDLGSGLGKALFYLSERFGCTCLGVEVNRQFVKVSRWCQTFLGFSKVSFMCGDFLSCDFPKGDVYIIAGTCFPSEMMNEILEKIKSVNQPVWVVSVSDPLLGESFEIIEKQTLPFSWGKDDCYLLYYKP